MVNTRVSDLTLGGAFASTDQMYVVETVGVGGVKKTGAQLEEYVRDTIGAALVNGTNISIVVDDGADTITVNFTGTLYTDEAAQDAVGGILTATTEITPTYDDVTPQITFALNAGSVANAKLASMAEGTIKGRADGAGTGAPTDLTPAQIRAVADVQEALTSNRTYFVATTGNDSNDGSSGSPWLTLQKACDVIAGLNLAGFTVTVNVADGTYTGGCVIPHVNGYSGVDSVQFVGNTTTPSNVLINSSAIPFDFATAAIAKINGFKLQTTQAFNGGVQMNNPGAAAILQNMDFGACSGYHVGVAAPGCLITILGGYTISGGAKRHFSVQGLGKISHTGTSTVTLTGTPNFSNAFAYGLQLGHLLVHSGQITYSGSATGKRYEIVSNSVAETFGGGATFFPGNAAGTTATGGQYV